MANFYSHVSEKFFRSRSSSPRWQSRHAHTTYAMAYISRRMAGAQAHPKSGTPNGACTGTRKPPNAARYRRSPARFVKSRMPRHTGCARTRTNDPNSRTLAAETHVDRYPQSARPGIAQDARRHDQQWPPIRAAQGSPAPAPRKPQPGQPHAPTTRQPDTHHQQQTPAAREITDPPALHTPRGVTH